MMWKAILEAVRRGHLDSAGCRIVFFGFDYWRFGYYCTFELAGFLFQIPYWDGEGEEVFYKINFDGL